MTKKFAFQHGQIAICSDRGSIEIKDNNSVLYRQQNAFFNLGGAITADIQSAASLVTQSANIFETSFSTYILRHSFNLYIFILIVVASLRAKIEFVFTAKQNCQLKNLKWSQLILVCRRNREIIRHIAS